ncbi:MAG: SDR family oxidoreductase [Ruminococcaceae bacterium]|nr:SDR family oxidoreductase [Oscillospiraceae bacterium]
MTFCGKTVIITGAAVGIGYATAMKFAMNGANLILFDLNEEKLNEVKKKLPISVGEVRCVVGDVSDEAFVKSSVQEVISEFGSVDVLVNNAAVWRCWRSFVETPSAEWKKYIDINIMGSVYFCQAVLPSMIEHNGGRIVNVASVAGVYGNANMVHYSATKGAIIAFTKALAKEVAANNILVNAVSPGSVSPSKIDDYNYYCESELSYLGRTGTDMENANLIYFLASDEASYISGQNIQIDGCRKKQ